MAKYQAIKNEVQARHEKLFRECKVFWAFSSEQFNEGRKKCELKEGEKLTSIGAGGYLPSANFEQLEQGLKSIDAWRKASIKAAKAEEVILHELRNYEAFYTGELDDAMEVLGDNFTIDEVRAVYRKHLAVEAEA